MAGPSMKIDDVRRITIVGAGTMGLQIAFQCAAHDYDVAVYDVEEGVLERAGERIAAYSQGLEDGGLVSAATRSAARARITLTSELGMAARDADLLSEAVPEDPALKGRVLGG
jgi:3-hydroxybutyryl-CoA dehydrogenase